MARSIDVYSEVTSMYRRKILDTYSRDGLVARFGDACFASSCGYAIQFVAISELTGFLNLGILVKSDYESLVKKVNSLFVE